MPRLKLGIGQSVVRAVTLLVWVVDHLRIQVAHGAEVALVYPMPRQREPGALVRTADDAQVEGVGVAPRTNVRVAAGLGDPVRELLQHDTNVEPTEAHPFSGLIALAEPPEDG